VVILICSLPVPLKKYSSGTNSDSQSERAGEHRGLAVVGLVGGIDGVEDRGVFDVETGVFVDGFTDPVNEAHNIWLPTKAGY
jgi:hypothetical protein